MAKKSAPSAPVAGPRPEAQSFKKDDLTAQQDDVYRRALSLIETIAKKKPGPPEEKDKPGFGRFLPRVEKPRDNHVVLIDGARGSGKTSVLLSLLRHWRRAAQSGGLVIPVGLLDLEPMKKPASLILHLTGSLFRVVDAMGEPQENRKRARWEAPATPRSSARDAWQVFVRTVAVGWDANIALRAGNVDVETYVAEIEQAEQERLDVQSAFTAFMDALVEEYRDWAGLADGQRPLFVVSIDDADMNAERNLDVLRLLRTFWHERLVFLVTGDSDLFARTLRLHYVGALSRLLDTGAFLGVQEAERLGDREKASGLARAAYDKAVPRAHRLLIEELRQEDRLSFHGVDNALRQVELGRGWLAGESIETLADYFKRPQICAALPGNLRGLIDLQAYASWVAQGEAPGRGRAAATKVLREMWLLALRASNLTPQDEAALDDVVGDPLHLPTPRIRSDLFRFDPHLSPIHPVQVEYGRVRVAVATPEHWYCLRRMKKGGDERVSAPICATLMLATDVVASMGYSARTLSGDGAKVAFGASYFEFRPDVWYRFPLPIPNWASFSAFDRVANALVGHRLPHDQETYDDFVRRLIAGILMTLVRPSFKPISTDDSSWGNLASGVGKLVHNDFHAFDGAGWAVSLAGLFAAPESGLSKASADKWLRSLREACGEEWGYVATALHEEREDRANSAVASPVSREAPSASYVEASEYLDSWAGLFVERDEWRFRDPPLSRNLNAEDEAYEEDEEGEPDGADLLNAIREAFDNSHPWYEIVAPARKLKRG
ncbi:MAG: hypothetical protein QM820_21570 [Minicystis sp.]